MNTESIASRLFTARLFTARLFTARLFTARSSTIISSPDTAPLAPRDKWPPGLIGFISYVTDCCLFRFDQPVDWPSAVFFEHAGLIPSATDGQGPPPGTVKKDGAAASTAAGGPPGPRVGVTRVAGVTGGLVWFATLFGAAFLLYVAVTTYQRAKERLTEQVGSYAHLLAEHDRYAFTLADALLKGVADHLTPADFSAVLPAERHSALHALLVLYKNRLPGVASFSIIGTDGIRRVGAVGQDFTDLSHRGYFQTLKTSGLDFYISNAEAGLASSKPGVHVARRFSLADGTFGGVIELNLALQDVFFRYYSTLNIDKDFSTTLRDPTHTIMSYPIPVTSIKADPHDGELVNALRSGVSRGTIEEVKDGVAVLTAFERLDGSGIYATVSTPTACTLSDCLMTIAGAVFAACVCLLGGFTASLAISRNKALSWARDEALRSGEDKRRLIQQMVTIAEDERKTIAADIHDELNPYLITARLGSQRILSLSREGKTEVLPEIEALADTLVVDIKRIYAVSRTIVNGLRLEILDVLGLIKALEEVVSHYDSIFANCRFSFDSSGDLSNLPDAVSLCVYRICQEALANAAKHSGASSVSVHLAGSDELIELTVVDNGTGFLASSGTGDGLGIVAMRERVATHGGTLTISSLNGVRLVARLPLPARRTVS